MIDYKKIFMLANSTNEESALKFSEEYYTANIKFDGERILAIIIDNEVILVNRRGKICNFHFEEIVEDLKKIKTNCIIDGELISVDDDFTKLQSRAMTKTPSKIKELTKTIPLTYMIFDVLKIEDRELFNTELKDRILEMNLLLGDIKFEHTKIAEHKPIKEMLEQAKAEKREGIMVKKLSGKYESRRSDNWLKLKFWNEIDLIFIKFEENPSGIKVFSKDGNIECQVQGKEQSQEVREILEAKGEVELTIQYLTRNPITQKLRFPSFKKVVYN